MIILSDLSDVLIGGLRDTAILVYQKFGDKASRECWRRFDETEKEFGDLMRGKITEEEYYDVFFANGMLFTREDLADFFSASFQRNISGTWGVYQRIKSYPKYLLHPTLIQEGVPDIYIVSDHIKERIDEIKGWHPEIFSFTAGEFWSCELGKIKRDPHFFEELLDKLGVEFDEVVFIDDNPINIRAAKKAGITGIAFTSSEELEQNLASLGFTFA